MPTTRTQRSTPSRKKSCLQCAKSKVRCGLERPSCQRCVASSRRCTYATEAPPSPTIRAAAPASIATPASLSTAFTEPSDVTVVSEREPLPTLPPLTQAQVPVQARDETLNFASVDLVPLAGADQIRDRWLRPFLAVTGQQELPKAFHPYTLQYMSCVLRTYPKQMANDSVPPFIHPTQMTTGHVALANCYSLVRLWHHRAAGSEAIVADTVQREMDRLAHVSASRLCRNAADMLGPNLWRH